MGFEDVGRPLPAQEQSLVQFDPYSRPPVLGMNERVIQVILDSKIKDKNDFEEMKTMLMVLIDNVARIPNIEMQVVRKLQRDMADILALSQCQGTKQKVLSRMTHMIFEIRSLVAYGGAPLVGLSGVSAIITTRQQQQQQAITYPQEPPQPQRKRILGLF